MSTLAWAPSLLAAVVYAAFLAWYGGRGRPMDADERRSLLDAIRQRARHPDSRQALAEIERLVADDDGREFVMHNLVRHRARAAYPAGHDPGGTAQQADRRYGRAIIWPLLRYGNLPLFIAPRAGHFIELPGAPDWHYVAMVRYRSRRDFLRFALAIEDQDIVVHKWAAIETTHVFPVRPIFSLVSVRGLVALGLGVLVLAAQVAVGVGVGP